MKKLIPLVALSAALLSPLTAALADQNDGGFFVRGNAGQSDYRVSNQYFSSNTGFGWDLGLGYRWATPSGNWGIDAGYVDLGKAKLNNSYVDYESGYGIATSGKAATHGWTLGANYLYQFENNWNIQARTGLAFTKSRATITLSDTLGNSTDPVRGSDNSTSWYGGVGVGYDFNRNFGVSLNYDYYGLSLGSKFKGDGSASVISLGAEYRF
ncbi:OmpA-OmpF porin, OOP family [Dyella jiangningensis]|uniref:outer membrane protein n=1 Tax=Dyella sp. AtDHG13 TaxID=1938897 RepID=UPI0008919D89|nr:porin family protein [Dyella sp. AtDHG13]PXV58367.1 outer membrane immunogenic protein [Dyella sp. AtDHG13]SDK05330.1 OmpA-OmpF porin, OOP family [Dyella jiangningensis]